MGSNAQRVNLLEYLRSKSQVDCDSLDIPLFTELGPFVDCTSNQADSYLELLNPQRAALLKKSAALAREITSDFPGVPFEKLAVEISMISVSLTLVPLITGVIHVMSDPTLVTTQEIFESVKRIHSLTHRLDPAFDINRLCIKVVATWEGLQACRKLSSIGIKTLATTLFTIEQAILAGEAGCIYIAPFLHELKAFFDDSLIRRSYKDDGPILGLCVEAQDYYRRFSYQTRVKAAGGLTVEEVLAIAGVDSLTIAPALLRTLSEADELEETVKDLSLFEKEDSTKAKQIEHLSFVNDEAGFREAFSKANGGQGVTKTQQVIKFCIMFKAFRTLTDKQAIDIFSEYQLKGEALMRDTDLTRIGP
ncbi:MAG: hypothetical protein Q9167_005055 [Letrouitia subvulpina]